MKEILVPSAELRSSGTDYELIEYPTLDEHTRMQEAFARMYFDVMGERVDAPPGLSYADVASFSESFDRSVERAMVAHQILQKQQPVLYSELVNLMGTELQGLQSTLALFLSKSPSYRLGFADSEGESFESGCKLTVQHLRFWKRYDKARIEESAQYIANNS